MTEKYLIDLLSNESEKMCFEEFEEKNRFDTEICGWKDINPVTVAVKPSPELTKFRIRTLRTKDSLSRSYSSKSQLSTLSSGNSRNSSPCGDGDKEGKNKKNSANLFAGHHRLPFPNVNANGHMFPKPPRAKKLRKPIKVFKLPNVSQENDE